MEIKMKGCFLIEWQRQRDQLFIGFNLANFFSIARMVFSIILIILAVSKTMNELIMLLLVVFGGGTDKLDGWAAKKYRIATVNGGKLDRLADKIYFATAIVIHYIHFWPLVAVDAWLKSLTELQGKIILAFEAVLLVSGIYGLIKGLNIMANEWGRRKMFFESAAVIGLYLGTVIELYLGFRFFYFWIYVINGILAFAIVFAVKSFEGYFRRWTV